MEQTTRFLPWFREHAHHFAGILFDIDGTIIRNKMPLEGAGEALDFVMGTHMPHLFLTNDACHSRQEKSRVLQAVDLPVAPEAIVSSGDTLHLLVQQQQLQGQLFFIMGKFGEPNYAEMSGLNITRNFSDLRHCRGVIIGESQYDWESTFNAVLNYFLKKPEGLLIVPNPDDYFVDQDREIHVAPGAKAAFLCMMLAKWGVVIEPLALGKPHTPIFDYARHTMIRDHNLPPQLDSRKILMVGDSLASDIAGANMAGLSSCLLLTGVTSKLMIEQVARDSQQHPTYWFESL